MHFKNVEVTIIFIFIAPLPLDVAMHVNEIYYIYIWQTYGAPTFVKNL
jgi:hypothetical protein